MTRYQIIDNLIRKRDSLQRQHRATEPTRKKLQKRVTASLVAETRAARAEKMEARCP